MLGTITTKYARNSLSNSLVTFVTRMRFAVLFFLLSCYPVSRLAAHLWVGVGQRDDGHFRLFHYYRILSTNTKGKATLQV